MKFRLFLTLLVSQLLFSCAFHSGNISTGNPPDCPLTSIATGTAYTFHILGIGGLDKAGLVLEAKKDLYRSVKYTKNRKLSNFAADFQTTFYLIFIKTKVTVSADVFDCDTDFETQKNEINDKKSKEQLLYKYKGFSTGDSVIYVYRASGSPRLVRAQITLFEKNKPRVAYLYDGVVLESRTNIEDLLKTDSDSTNLRLFGYDIGDKVKCNVYSSKAGQMLPTGGKVLGVNDKYILFGYQDEIGNPKIILVLKEEVSK